MSCFPTCWIFLYRADIPIDEYTFCDKEVRYIPFDEFKMMVESGSPMLLPYETHYRFLLIALNSQKKGLKKCAIGRWRE